MDKERESEREKEWTKHERQKFCMENETKFLCIDKPQFYPNLLSLQPMQQ